MITKDELEFIKARAMRRQAAFLENNPGVQVPPDEGTEVLRLVAEIERLDASARSAVTDGVVVGD